MKNGIALILIISLLMGIGGFGVWATEVLSPIGKTPNQIVLARKLAMEAIGANVGEILQKIKAGSVEGLAVNAKNIAALAVFTPLVFDQVYLDAYPNEKRYFYFKGATLPDFQNLTADMNRQAEVLMNLALKNDQAGVEGQVPKLLETCKACHSKYRGEKQ